MESLLLAAADVETPCAAVDEAALERNLQAMQARAAAAGLLLRPHAKTHKSSWIAQRQRELGAIGVTVATLQEAETFAAAGIEDILLAHPPAGRPKLDRLGPLAGRCRLSVSLDTVSLAAALPQNVGVWWEVDTGLHRVGTAPGTATVRSVGELLQAIAPERFRGLLTHGGHAYAATSVELRRRAADEEIAGLVDTAGLLRERGIAVPGLSIGSTPTAADARPDSGVTEMRPGTYAFGDANQVSLGAHRLADCALCVIATVVSRPAADRLILDAGSKAVSTDLRAAGVAAPAVILDQPQLAIERLSEEHAIVSGSRAADLRVGDRVALLPAHVCTTVNLHSELLVVSAGGRSRWETVDARGWRRVSGQGGGLEAARD